MADPAPISGGMSTTSGPLGDPAPMAGIMTGLGSDEPFGNAPFDDSFFDAYLQQLELRASMPEPMLTAPMSANMATGPHSLRVTEPAHQPGVVEPPLDSSFDLVERYLVPGLDEGGDLQDLAFEDEELEDASPELSPGAKAAKKAKQRPRSDKQQELNKQAQQRYRERRKQKFMEMERQVEELTRRVGELQAVEGKNMVITRRNEYLERLVKIQLEEIKNLKREVALQASELEHSGEQRPSHLIATDPAKLREQLASDVLSLDTVLKSNGVDRGPAPALPEQALKFFRKKVLDICDIHVRLPSVEVPEAADMMSHAAKSTADDNPQVEECVRNLGLNNEQTSVILKMREDHLTRMRHVYLDRSALNMKAMGLMLPHPLSEKDGPFDATIDGKINCQQQRGYHRCKDGDNQLTLVLNEIRENLLREQHSFMEMVTHLLSHILDPVQAALVLVASHPSTVDALMVANILAAQHSS
ncbi:unnamed protein product [Ostreobium quekettii]|uniref:BZIP domain-containing protein n=1 Tax=Ostreobium quekettii TaxID=121088 RepID=A0A8S1IPQ5_9CHLO|nr:unnamed protein product [Ostreobium quekettii]|eukprot:evm.model.scf_469.10 EVM.evm.TU.scf_469.10   scf_469:69922-74591(-)